MKADVSKTVISTLAVVLEIILIVVMVSTDSFVKVNGSIFMAHILFFFIGQFLIIVSVMLMTLLSIAIERWSTWMKL